MSPPESSPYRTQTDRAEKEPRDPCPCVVCGEEIRERALKGGPCWVRVPAPGSGGALTICEHSPDYHHHPDLGPESGHTFRVSVISRGSYAVAGIEGHTDAEEFMGPAMTLDVRAWNLPDALRRVSHRPLAAWFAADDNDGSGADQ